jgi:putative endonuclease
MARKQARIRLDPPVGQNIRLGRLGEALAVRFLSRKGWLIMDRNWRCRWGEIDVVAVDGPDLVVCEVKTRASSRNGTPLESITPVKVRRLHRLAELWLCERGGQRERVRIDAIGVLIDPRDGQYRIHHARGI